MLVASVNKEQISIPDHVIMAPHLNFISSVKQYLAATDVTIRFGPGWWDGESRWVLQLLAELIVSSMHNYLRKERMNERGGKGRVEVESVRQSEIKMQLWRSESKISHKIKNQMQMFPVLDMFPSHTFSRKVNVKYNCQSSRAIPKYIIFHSVNVL